MGEHTDVQDGITLGVGIDLRSAVAIARREDDRILVASDLVDDRAETTLGSLAETARLDAATPAERSDWKSYVLGTVWASLVAARGDEAQLGDTARELFAEAHDRSFTGTGLDVFVTTDVPIGAGLAASASMCGAISSALDELWDFRFTTAQLAAIGHTAENGAVLAPTGLSDHFTVLSARPRCAVFFDARGNDAFPIELPESIGIRLRALVVDTRETHRNWTAEFAERLRSCASAAEAIGVQTLREARLEELEAARDRMSDTDFRRARHVMTEIQRTLALTRSLRADEGAGSAQLFSESNASQRDDFGIFTERTTFTSELLLHLDAAAVRLSGAGVGGSLLALVPIEAVDHVRQVVVEAYREHGWETPHIFELAPCDGPRNETVAARRTA